MQSNYRLELTARLFFAGRPQLNRSVSWSMKELKRSATVAKATMVLQDGTKVTIEGTSEEVATLLSKVSQGGPVAGSAKTPSGSKTMIKSPAPRKKPVKGPVGHISALREEGFFKSRQTLPDIQRKLEEQGHIYAQSSLSPALVRLVRKRELRRIKEKKGWVYVSG